MERKIISIDETKLDGKKIKGVKLKIIEVKKLEVRILNLKYVSCFNLFYFFLSLNFFMCVMARQISHTKSQFS